MAGKLIYISKSNEKKLERIKGELGCGSKGYVSTLDVVLTKYVRTPKELKKTNLNKEKKRGRPKKWRMEIL